MSLTKNAFKCFHAGCKARGNVLDLVAALEQCSVREAALKLAAWFGVGERVRPTVDQAVDAAQREQEKLSIANKLHGHWRAAAEIHDRIQNDLAELRTLWDDTRRLLSQLEEA